MAALTAEKIDQLTEKFCDRVIEKMDVQDFATESVHEDIRMMHHLAKLKLESQYKDNELESLKQQGKNLEILQRIKEMEADNLRKKRKIVSLIFWCITFFLIGAYILNF